MDLLWLLPGFVKVFQCISHPLTNKTKLKFDQELKACRSFCFELKVLNKSNDSMPWACCAFGNVYSTIFGLLVRSKTDNTWTSLLLSALLGLHIFWFWPIGRGEGSATFQSSHRQPNRCLAAPPMPSWSWCPACCWPDWPVTTLSKKPAERCWLAVEMYFRWPVAASHPVLWWSWRRGIYCFSHRPVTTISETKQRHRLYLILSLVIMSQ